MWLRGKSPKYNVTAKERTSSFHSHFLLAYWKALIDLFHSSPHQNSPCMEDDEAGYFLGWDLLRASWRNCASRPTRKNWRFKRQTSLYLWMRAKIGKWLDEQKFLGISSIALVPVQLCLLNKTKNSAGGIRNVWMLEYRSFNKICQPELPGRNSARPNSSSRLV